MVQHWTPPSFDAADVVMPAVSVARTFPEPQPAPPPVTVPVTSPQDLFLRGLQEGLEEGRQQGLTMGREEGFAKGREEGFQAGFQQGYQGSLEKIETLTASLQSLLESLRTWPQELESSLNELVYETALRLAGKESMDRAVFQRAIQDALIHMPRPGESLLMRVPVADHETWTSVLADGPSRFALSLQVDDALEPGHAFIEVQGARLDVGARARQALVRSALGLLSSDHPDAKV